VHLTGRPITQKRRCVLGRETAIQELEWHDDGWPWLKAGGNVPELEVDVPGTRDDAPYWAEQRYDFSRGLHKDFQWLRTPEPERIFALNGNTLTLIGRESIGSWFEQALVARRQTHFSYDAEVTLEFSPTDERQFAGLTGYYSRFNFHYLAVTAHADGQRELLIMSSLASFPFGRLSYPADPVRIPNSGAVRLKMEVRGAALQFFYALGVDTWSAIGPVLDASLLSDECGGHPEHGSFTGAFVGMAASDLNGTAREANFTGFVYRPVHHETDRY
jgi:xylan 1,4-beta-xylosidase